MNAGKGDDFYLKNADYIIYNNEGEAELVKKFGATICEILKQGEQL
jgi:hypothetical protein